MSPVPKPNVQITAENPAESKLPDVPPDHVVMTVGDLKITAAQFDRIIDALSPQYRPIARGRGRRQFAENLVRILALAQEGRARKLDQSEAFKAQANFAADNVLASMITEDINKNIKVEEADLQKYYADHKADYEQIRARHILIRAQGSPAPVKPGQKDLSDAEALAKAQEIRKRLEGGADFAAIANQESDDTSANNGGDLGFFHRGQMVPSFEEAAFALKPGEMSQPVKTQFGYHIIKVEATEVKPFDDLKSDIEGSLRPELVRKAVEQIQKKSPPVLDNEFFGPAK